MHPSFHMARILILQGEITRFGELFGIVPRYRLGEVIGFPKYETFTRRFNDPRYLTVGDVIKIADALGVDYTDILKLVLKQIKEKDQLDEPEGHRPGR